MIIKFNFSVARVVLIIFLVSAILFETFFSTSLHVVEASSGGQKPQTYGGSSRMDFITGGLRVDTGVNSSNTEVLSESQSPSVGNCALFPSNNIWNARIDGLPVHSHSNDWVNSIGRNTGFHMDFGSGTWDGGPIGIPYNFADETTPRVAVNFYYPAESDRGPYPIPANPLIEYGSDHHLLIVDKSTCRLYEIYDASYSGGIWHAGSGAIWNLSSNALRPDTWTSADAAGLSILPGLIRYEEIANGKIEHAIRFTAAQTNRYIWPARHLTSDDPNAPQIPPMGARFRLKASFDISRYAPQMQVILRAMKTYGIILADNGSNWYVSGAPDARWNNDMLHTLDNLTGNDFEAVDTFLLMIDRNSGEAKTTAVTISGNAGVSGAILRYVDGSLKGIVADANGNYVIKVPYNWSGKITPAKTGVYSFTPAVRTYSGIKVNQAGQNYRANRLAAFTSLAVQDGYLRESTENSGVAGALNVNSAVIVVGDDVLNRQYRAILSFDTRGLPDNAVIISARLKLKKQSGAGIDPMGTHGWLVMDIRQPNFGATPTIALDDFAAIAGMNSAGWLGKIPTSGVYTGVFGPAAYAHINRIGLTQMRLRFQLDDDNNLAANWLAFFSGEAATMQSRPSFEVIYYTP
jgi:hypothetical protein